MEPQQHIFSISLVVRWLDSKYFWWNISSTVAFNQPFSRVIETLLWEGGKGEGCKPPPPPSQPPLPPPPPPFFVAKMFFST